MSKVKAGFSKDIIFEMRLKGFSRDTGMGEEMGEHSWLGQELG